MRCEVLAVGTELLLGQVVDTNSAWIGEQLALAGIDSLLAVKVGDNRERIVRALRDALARADAVICCGGLGPTQDDITREAIAEVVGVGLETRPELVEVIRGLFAGRGRPMPDNNLRQAQVPAGATVIPQTRGTAPGLICPVGDRVVYAVPGVPPEMRDMLTRAVLPDLTARAGERATIRSRTLRTWGLGESAVAERLAPRLAALDATGNPTIAFLASGIEGIKVRITARGGGADPAADAEARLAAEEGEVRALLGDTVFGVDDETMEAAVGALMRRSGRTLAVAESLTGGLIGARVTAVAGASHWFRGGIVSYASEVKRDLLGVGEGPVVSPGAAAAMAEGAARVLGADVGLSVTGVAGPAEQEGQPVGTVWVGLAGLGPTRTHHLRLAGDRDRIRQMTVIQAGDLLRRALLAGA
ncbi:MAG TPA: competence/damage-inducible protein A [Acidimicrobiales bacterium]|nr:competence/damage-inducible protein A [Acidimicrobiales bacterium]